MVAKVNLKSISQSRVDGNSFASTVVSDSGGSGCDLTDMRQPPTLFMKKSYKKNSTECTEILTALPCGSGGREPCLVPAVRTDRVESSNQEFRSGISPEILETATTRWR